ncbi:PREDICTED: uncharacterized protein LOC18606880 isoform X1 [Theobroma cacao]|uniref:Uncharacterized protein LOC18606880 isoform X1 n=1 Tax=Theobroma cacao TaxID=3641 RepID=A0AB32VHF6_THECC|nr:PREDICTED: uncharacterized protein LOC18606880 isoform X1 [Theobroma cacao]
MSSTNVGSELKGSTESPLTIQEIIERISKLRDSLPSEDEEEGDSPQQTTGGTITAADKQDGSESGDVRQENDNETNKQEEDVSQQENNKQEEDVSQQENNDESKKKGEDVSQQENNDESNKMDEDASKKKSDESNKKDKDARKKKSDESNKRKAVLHELVKFRKELQYMISSFEKLKKFETNLREPLQTLDDNVQDILKDLPCVTVSKLPKQVPLNLRVLRNNITRVKIQIPLQHQTANTNSEANRPWQTTVATSEADLPHLYDEAKFESSYYFKEIEEKYNELDDRQKLCLLCFVIFPENAEMKKRLLRFWWVGEKLLSVKEEKEEMELVSQTIQTFVEKGLIEPVQKKNKLQPRSYKMNPIVRSCLIKFAKQAGFFDYDSEGKPTMDFSSCKKACMVKSGAPADWFSAYLTGTVTETAQNEGTVTETEQKKGTATETAQNEGTVTETEQKKGTATDRLSADLVKLQMLFNFPKRKTLLEASQRFHELQTLFNISKQFPALPKEWFSKMTGINVLYLGRWESGAGRQRHIEVEDTDFLKGLKYMKKLRLLSLQGISGIPKLPSSLCKLANLRILDLRACHSLEKLPERIGSLKKLTYLDSSECYLLDDMPKQLNQLEQLQVLKGFVIGNDRNSCTLADLAELKKLRKLSVNVNTTEFNIEDAGLALSKFQKLQKLKIAWGSGGLTGNNSTQNSIGQQSDPSNPNGESKKQDKDAVKPKTQNQVSSAAKSPSGKQDKGEDNGNRESSAGDQEGAYKKLKSGEANSKSMNQEDDKKGRNIGAAKSVAFNVSEKHGSKKQETVLQKRTPLMKLTSLRRERKPTNFEGLESLVKLDLQCFPHTEPPTWLTPKMLNSLQNLSVRGGRLRHLNQEGKEKWKVETLRLKFLIDFKMNWKEMLEQFPELKYLEKVRCPRITFCPCDARGVWQESPKSS